MKSRPLKIIGLVLGSLLLVGLWLFFGPEKLGGSTTYSITSGTSMEPLLHKNDLALVRAQPAYEVGDIVLYHSSSLKKPVLHRVVVIQNGNYFFRGDNNNFVDPGHATRGELVGKLWVHVPALGGVLGWFGKPMHAALLAGLLTILLILGSITTIRHRRKRRGIPPRQAGHSVSNTRGLPPAASSVAASPGKSGTELSSVAPSSKEAEFLPARIAGPPTTFALFFVALSLAILCLVLSFSRPPQQLAPLNGAYQQRGTFSYMAPVRVPTTVYPQGIVKTGDPIYPSLVDWFTINFKYQFTSKLPHNIKGTTELKASVLSKTDTWQELRVLQPIKSFSGDEAIINWDSSLTALFNLIDTASAQTGIASTSYEANIQPIVHITGTVEGKPIKDKFAPVLPFTISRSVITLSDTATPTPPGATYVPPTADATRAATLNPSQAGSIPHLANNTVDFARYSVSVPLLRWLGFALLALTFAIGVVHDILRRRQQLLSQEELTAKRFEDLLVPTSGLRAPDGATVIKVSDFAHLAELARYLERPILYEPDTARPLYAIDDGTNHYVFRGAHRSRGIPSAAHLSPGNSSAYLKRLQSKLPLQILIVLIVLAVIATLVNTLTAGNTVPPSRVGRSVNARTITQLKPTGCSALNLTTIVYKSGTSSNTVSDALIIGTSGVETLNDTGARNCIVGGGGADKITGRATSTCIVGPTSGATYTTCTKKTQ